MPLWALSSRLIFRSRCVRRIKTTCLFDRLVGSNKRSPEILMPNAFAVLKSLTETPKAFDPMLLVCSDLMGERTCMTEP
jgi:hypothetical protein